jgi:WD40 repeat protein
MGGIGTIFTNLCNVEDSHKNTITSLCFAPSTSDGNNRTAGDQMFNITRKIFTSSLDSTVKCWLFNENNEAPNAPTSLNRTPLSPFDPEGDSLVAKPFNYNGSFNSQQKLVAEFSEIQQNGRASKRVKVNAMAYMPYSDLLVTGGTDRFINLYSNSQGNSKSTRYKCAAKIAKQGASSVVNSMCTLDTDKVIIGQSDENIRLYQIPPSGMNANDQDSLSTVSSSPLVTYKFEDSGINNLCSLNDQNLFISSGFNRSISVWDTRQT